MKIKKCPIPNCGGSLLNEDGILKCFNCGYERMSPAKKHDFITTNAKEIAEDFRIFGYTKTVKKWGISEATLYKLPEVREVMMQKVVQSNGDLPRLPIFSNEWASEVQLKWLEVWGKQKSQTRVEL